MPMGPTTSTRFGFGQGGHDGGTKALTIGRLFGGGYF